MTARLHQLPDSLGRNLALLCRTVSVYEYTSVFATFLQFHLFDFCGICVPYSSSAKDISWLKRYIPTVDRCLRITGFTLDSILHGSGLVLISTITLDYYLTQHFISCSSPSTRPYHKLFQPILIVPVEIWCEGYLLIQQKRLATLCNANGLLLP